MRKNRRTKNYYSKKKEGKVEGIGKKSDSSFKNKFGSPDY